MLLRKQYIEERMCDMAHIENYHFKDIKSILDEHDRKLEKYKNEVDLNRSHSNFAISLHNQNVMSLFEQAKQFYGKVVRIQNGLSDQDYVKPHGEKLMFEWAITYPKKYCDKVPLLDDSGNQKTDDEGHGKFYYKPKDINHCIKFFKTVSDFTENRYNNFELDLTKYGYKKCSVNRYLGINVHLDETTPHAHVFGVPFAISKKTGKYTISASSMFPKSELRKFQNDLEKYLNQEFEIEPGMTFGTLSDEKQKQIDNIPENVLISQNEDYNHNVGQLNLELFKQLEEERNQLEEERRQLKEEQAKVQEQLNYQKNLQNKINELDDLIEQYKSAKYVLNTVAQQFLKQKDNPVIANRLNSNEKLMRDLIAQQELPTDERGHISIDNSPLNNIPLDESGNIDFEQIKKSGQTESSEQKPLPRKKKPIDFDIDRR